MPRDDEAVEMSVREHNLIGAFSDLKFQVSELTGVPAVVAPLGWESINHILARAAEVFPEYCSILAGCCNHTGTVRRGAKIILNKTPE